jgi:hypothetical protein
MNWIERTTLFLIAVAAVSSVAAAAAPNFISNYAVFQNWLPVIFIAVLFGIAISAVYYMIGALLNSNKIKAGAIGELGQTVGTGVVTIIIIGVFTLVGTGQLSLVPLLSPNSISTGVCSQLASSPLTMLNSHGSTQPAGDSNPANAIPTPANAVCSGISSLANGQSGADLTPSIDYGLFYSYAILANVTNQAANNLNAFYVFTGWIGFLSEFTARSVVCTPSPECLVPGAQELSFSTAYDYKPLAGYSAITSLIGSAQTEAVLVFYIMLMQLLFITIFLLIWPYLLAAGIIMQATFFTRKIGGLLIGISLSAVLVYPILLGMEYSAFSNPGLGPIGSSNLPGIPLYELPASGNAIVYGANTMQNGYVPANTVPGASCTSGDYVFENVCGYPGTYTSGCVSLASAQSNLCKGTAGSNIDFFVLPSATNVLRYYSCMPDYLVVDEGIFAAFYLIPGYGFLSGAIGTLVTGIPANPTTLPIPVGFAGSTQYACNPSDAINSALALANLYGVNFVAGVIIPLINVLVALAAMSGFSTLLGGDKDILGLSNLI